jgi:hypothetical protein
MLVGVLAAGAVMHPGGERALAQVVLGGAAGGIAFLAAARLMRIEELDVLRSLLPGGRKSVTTAGGVG